MIQFRQRKQIDCDQQTNFEHCRILWF